jgi:hypothetical protein
MRKWRDPRMDEKRRMPGSERTRGTGDDSGRNRGSDSDRSSGSSSSSRERSTGISNRSMDEEISEQEELPERGSRQSER